MTKQIFSFFILLQERAKPIRPRAFFRLSLRARSKLPTVAGESERRALLNRASQCLRSKKSLKSPGYTTREGGREGEKEILLS